MFHDKKDELEKLCEKYHVLRLGVFGSAANGKFDPEKSDIDFLVEFGGTDTMNVADQYFGLLDGLIKLFNRDAHLVMKRAMRNPYFIKSVNQNLMALYAA